VTGDWLPPREKREPAWAARAMAMQETRFRRLAAFFVLEILVAVACLFTGVVPVMVLGPVVAAWGGYCGFAAERRGKAARRTGWRRAAVTVGMMSTRDTSAAIAVRFADGSRIDLRSGQAGSAVRALAELSGLPAIVAGYGPAMTVLVLPNPPLREAPVLVGACAETYRWTPDS
jgi:hypothetical protein